MSNATLIAADLDAMFPPGFHSHTYQNHAATIKTAAQMLREQDRQIESLRTALRGLAIAADERSWGEAADVKRRLEDAASILEQTAR